MSHTGNNKGNGFKRIARLLLGIGMVLAGGVLLLVLLVSIDDGDFSWALAFFGMVGAVLIFEGVQEIRGKGFAGSMQAAQPTQASQATQVSQSAENNGRFYPINTGAHGAESTSAGDTFFVQTDGYPSSEPSGDSGQNVDPAGLAGQAGSAVLAGPADQAGSAVLAGPAGQAGSAVLAEPDGQAGSAELTSSESSIFKSDNLPSSIEADNAIPTLISRSSNLLATLKDIARHANQRPDNYSAMDYLLASMINKSGLMTWDDPPLLQPFLLRRTEHHWLGSLEDLEIPAHIDSLLAVETALALDVDIRKRNNSDVRTLTVDDARKNALAVIESVLDLDGHLTRTPPLYEITYPHVSLDERPQEWYLREVMAAFTESVPLPARVAVNMRANTAHGLVVYSLRVPSPAVFSILEADTSDGVAAAHRNEGDGVTEQLIGASTAEQLIGASTTEQLIGANSSEQLIGAGTTEQLIQTHSQLDWTTQMSLNYALRVAFLFAQKTFETSPAVTDIVLNCLPFSSDECMVSLRLNRESFSGLLPHVRTDGCLSSEVHASPDVRMSWWDTAVEPFMLLDDEQVSPPERNIFPELQDKPCSEAMRELCCVDSVRDLGINEHAALLSAWDSLESKLTGSTSDMVSAIIALRDSTTDVSIIDACERSSKLLVESEDEVTREQIFETFLFESALIQAERNASALLEEDVPKFEEALTILNRVLEPIDSIGMYLDDSDTVYRYFGSLGERLSYNRACLDDGRKVKLVPDAYYNCHSLASQCLTVLNRPEEAMEHAEICSRIGPRTVDAVMRKLRILENDARIFEAEELIRSWLPNASIPRDVALCHYRLAYMEWKLGRNDLALACYRRSLEWPTPISEQAQSELDDLAKSTGIEQIPSLEQAKQTLTEANIPLGLNKDVSDSIGKMAALCVDDGLFTIARHYISIYVDIEGGDDELIDIYRWVM